MKKTISLLICLGLLMQCVAPAMAVPFIEEGHNDAADWVRYFVDEDLISPDPIGAICTVGGDTASFTYDGNGNRVKKYFNGEVTSFYYDDGNYLIQEYSSNGAIDYKYENIDGVYVCNGITLNGVKYLFQYDEYGNVAYILSEDLDVLCQYNYGETTVTCLEYVNGSWVENDQKNFIGNINPIQYNGWYFDRETNCFYLGNGIYYDYANNTHIMNAFSLRNSVSMRANNYYGEAAQTALGLLNMPSYSTARTQVSESEWNAGKRWYDGLSVEELAARCIYGENFHPDSYADRLGVLRVIANRMATLGGTVRQVITQYQQFSTINPKDYSPNACPYSRAMKNPSDPVWKEATILGCLLGITVSITDLGESVGGWPTGIDTQINFRGLTAVYANLTIKNGYLYLGSRRMNNPAIAGVGKINVTSSSTVDSLLSQYSGNNRYNIFFTQ